MAKNRKKQSDGTPFPASVAAVLGIAAVMALSYLWFSSRCGAIGVRIKALEEQKAEMHRRVLNEEYKWSNMKSPQNIEALLKQFNLEMSWPEEARVIRMHARHSEFQPAGGLLAKGNASPNLVIND